MPTEKEKKLAEKLAAARRGDTITLDTDQEDFAPTESLGRGFDTPVRINPGIGQLTKPQTTARGSIGSPTTARGTIGPPREPEAPPTARGTIGPNTSGKGAVTEPGLPTNPEVPYHYTFGEFMGQVTGTMKKVHELVSEKIKDDISGQVGYDPNVKAPPPRDPSVPRLDPAKPVGQAVTEAIQTAEAENEDPGNDIWHKLHDEAFNKLSAHDQIIEAAKVEPYFNGFTPRQWVLYREQNGLPIDPELDPGPYGFRDAMIDTTRPLVQDAAIAGGTALGGPGVGIGSGLAADYLMQAMKGKEESDLIATKLGIEPGTAGSRFVNSLQQYGTGAVLTGAGNLLAKTGTGAKLASVPLRKAEQAWGFAKGGPTNYPLLDKVGATRSMYNRTSKEVPENHGLLEHVFMPAMMQNARDAMQKETEEQFMSRIRSPHPNVSDEDLTLNYLSKMAQHDLDSGKTAAWDSIGDDAEVIRLRGKVNQSFTESPAPTSKTLPANPDVIKQPDPNNPGVTIIWPRKVNGGIKPSETQAAVNRYLGTEQRTYNQPFVPDSAKGILENYGKWLEEATDFGQHNLSVEEMLDQYQKMHKLANMGMLEGTEMTASRRVYHDLTNALAKDIQDGINGWTNDLGGKARDAFDRMRTTLDTATSKFGPEGEANALRKLMVDDVAPYEWLSKIVNNPNQLDNVLETGKITLPNGKVLSSDNIREHLQSYKLKEWRDAASARDPISGLRKYDPTKLSHLLDKAEDDGTFKLLWPNKAHRDDIRAVVQQLGMTEGGPNASAGNFKKFMTFRSGFLLLQQGLAGAGTGAYAASGHGLLGSAAGAAVGTVLSMGVMTRLLNNPTMAKRLANYAAGKPIGMSQEMFNKGLRDFLQGGAGSVVELLKPDGSTTPVFLKGKDVKPLTDKEAEKLRQQGR